MKKLLFIIGSIGSLNVANTIVHNLKNKKKFKKILITSLDQELIHKKFFSKIIYEKNKISKSKILKYLYDFQSKAIFVGSSGYYFLERDFLIEAKKNQIFTFCMLDSWAHPIERFKIFKNNKDIILPDYLGVPFFETKKTFLKLINNKNISVVGLPHLQEAAKRLYNYKKNIKNEIFILYISSPDKNPKPTKLSKHSISYNQQKIFDIFLSYLYEFANTKQIQLKIGIKNHPLENDSKNKLSITKESFKSKNIKIFNEKIKNKSLLLYKYNVVFGISSTMLLESIYCQIPTFSLQIGSGFDKRDNYFKNIPNLIVIRKINELKKYSKFITNKNKNKTKINKNIFKENLNFINFCNNIYEKS